MVKDLACVCSFCLHRNWFDYQIVQWIIQWAQKALQFMDTYLVLFEKKEY